MRPPRAVPWRRATGALIAMVLAGGALADGGYGGPSLSADAWPVEVVRRPRTLARDMLEIAAPLGIDVSVRSAGTPATAPLALHAGVTDWLTLGVGHARGFCLAGPSGGCAAAYDDFRVDAFARFYATGPLSAGYGAAVALASMRDGIALSAEAQLELRLAYDRFAFTLAPAYGFGLNRRATASRIEPAGFPLASSLAFGTFTAVANRETLHAPVTAEVQVLSRLALAAGIAVDGVVDPVVGRFGDGYRVPVGFAAVVTPARMLDVGAAFTFPNLAGRSDGARPRSDERVVQAFLSLRTGGGGSSPAAAVDAGPPHDAPAAAYTIAIEDFAFTPASLEVPPGATITVRNGDGVPHSVTSERARGAFAPGAVAGVSFDTGAFTGERSFTLPADATPGTVVPYYCSVHAARMRTPDGELRIAAAR